MCLFPCRCSFSIFPHLVLSIHPSGDLNLKEEILAVVEFFKVFQVE